MNRKQLTLLIVFGVVLGGLGLFVYQRQQSSFDRGSVQEGQKLLKGVPAAAINDVALITIKQSTNEVNLAKVNETWTVKERGGYPANFNNISDALRKFWDLKVTRQVKVGPSRLAQLKLSGSDGTLVELKDDKGKKVTSLSLGLQATKDSPGDSPFGGGSYPHGRYVQVGDDAKNVVLVSDPLSSVEPKAEDWLNKDWFKVEKPKAIAVVSTNATNNWKLERETESGEWKLADAKGDEKADSGKSSGLNYVLSSPSFNDVVIDPKPEALGLDHPTTANIETFDGFTYTLKMGKAPGDDSYAVQMKVAGNFAKERTPGKDEKPEDKEKLDKEFAEKKKQHEEKLKNEQQYEKWTYLVSKWTVDNLLKERKDFLAEKKEEPKKEEAKLEDASKAPPKGEEKPGEK